MYWGLYLPEQNFSISLSSYEVGSVSTGGVGNFFCTTKIKNIRPSSGANDV